MPLHCRRGLDRPAISTENDPRYSEPVSRRVGAVRRGGMHDCLGADVAASSRPILNDEGLAQPLGKPLTDQAP